jgi:hypothetical protein
MPVERSIPRPVLLPSLALLGLLIESVIFPHWHDACLQWITNGVEWWGSENGIGLPINALGMLLEDLFGHSILLLLLGVPIMFVGGFALGLLWIIPFLGIDLLLNLLKLGVSLHLLPTMLPCVLTYWFIRQWTPSLAGPHAGSARDSQTVESNLTCLLPAPDPSCPGLQLMTADHPLRHRIDPVTRTGFAVGERFVVCSGADRHAYKVTTCERLQHRCLFDGTALSATGPHN